MWGSECLGKYIHALNSLGIANLQRRGVNGVVNEFVEERAQTIINFLHETEAKPVHSGDYSCIAHNTEGFQTQNSLTVRVLGEISSGTARLHNITHVKIF